MVQVYMPASGNVTNYLRHVLSLDCVLPETTPADFSLV